MGRARGGVPWAGRATCGAPAQAWPRARAAAAAAAAVEAAVAAGAAA